MSEEMHEALFDQAVRLAYRTFPEPTDDHIEGVYHRLLANHRWGVGEAGVVTVH